MAQRQGGKNHDGKSGEDIVPRGQPTARGSGPQPAILRHALDRRAEFGLIEGAENRWRGGQPQAERHDQPMHPEHREMHLPHVLIVLAPVRVRFGLGRCLLGSLFSHGVLDLGRRDPRRVQPVRFVPFVGIVLQALKDARHVLAQAVLRSPAQKLLRGGQVELIMIAGNIDHPRPDESILAKYLVFRPGAELGQLGRHVPGDPVLAMQLAPDQALQLAEGYRVGLAQ